MARQHRIDPHGGVHHITNHRAGNDDLFLTDRDRILFLMLVEAARKETAVEVLGYCLMGNHYHLAVHCPTGELHRFVHYLQGNYARAFNYRHEHRGPVFRRRYHNVLITTDGQFQFTMRYIHRNPLELGCDIRTYPWSDYPTYRSSETATSRIVTINHSMVLQAFGSPTTYVGQVETDLVGDKFRMSSGRREIKSSDASRPRHELARLLATVADYVGCERANLTKSTRGQRNAGRLIATVLAADQYPEDVLAIRALLGFDTASAHRTTLSRARTLRATDDSFASDIAAIHAIWLDDRKAA